MNEPLWRRILRLHGSNPRADVQEEFAFHLEERADALMRKGIPADEARAQALRQFGDLPAAAATCSEIGSRRAARIRWRERFESVAQDLAYAMKTIRRSPGFALAAIATIALGVGANTAVFSLLNALLFQPLDASNPRELVRVYTSEGRAIREPRDLFGGSSYADYLDLRPSPALSGMLAYMPLGATISIHGEPGRFQARLVSHDYFSVIGRPLFRGHFTPDSAVGTPAVVSYQFWSTRLAADPAVIGRPLMVNGRTVIVTGVTSAAFRGIEPSTIDVYLPFRAAADFTGRPDVLTQRGARSVKLLGRLAPGISAEVAERELTALMTALGGEYPASNAQRIISVRRAQSIMPLETADGLVPIAGLVFGATAVMLAIAGVNVAAVLLGRTIRRRRELAVRVSLGASPMRVARQLLTENVVLALIAAVVVMALVSLLPVLAAQLDVPRSVEPSINVAVLGYAVAVATAFGICFGLAPALLGTRADIVESLRSGESDARPTRARAQKLLVGVQLSLSMILLLVGGALLDSVNRQQRVDPGFAVQRLFVAQFEDPAGMHDVTRERVFTKRAVERLAQLPGVRSLSVSSMAPLTGEGYRSTIHIPGYVEAPDEDMGIAAIASGPDLFKTLGIPIRRGRELTWADRDTTSKVIVNELMARRYWGTRNPVGTFVHLGGKGGRPAEVIGVMANARFRSLAEAPQPMFAVQRTLDGGGTLLIRASTEPTSLYPTVRALMGRSDVPLALVGLRTMEEVLRTSLAVSRAVSATLVTIGILAVLLAAVGLYGVVSYVMAGRTREFGVRRALGASHASIVRLVLGYGMRLAAVGGVVGAGLGLVAIKAIGAMLFGSWSAVPIVLVVALVLAAVTLAACAIPALRATATSPAVALRSD
jgi:putative ABC transport system permease protein